MFTIVQRIGAIPRAPFRHGQQDHSACTGAVPAAESAATGPGAFAPWLARARAARLLTEHL
ncbi:MAG TPA: hypothetical protein VGW40_05955 [Allosphingosinicella sp.]|nr:hypothetical protein [Allosphingosinicella sp.]